MPVRRSTSSSTGLRWVVLALGALVALLLGAWLAPEARAADLIPNVPDGEPGSLRHAIDTAAAGDVITLGPGVYPLSLEGADEDGNATGDLDITKDLTIRGAGQHVTVVDGAEARDRVFDVHGARLELEGLMVTGGGLGGIRNDRPGELVLRRTSVSGNDGALGGGIGNVGGSVEIVDSVLSGNGAPPFVPLGLRRGGAVWNNEGSVAISGSTLSGNSAQQGGAIYNVNGSIQIADSDFSANTAGSRGGAIVNLRGTGKSGGAVEIVDSSFSGNSVRSEEALVSGGAVYTGDNTTLEVAGSTFSGNSVRSEKGNVFGGAIDNDGRLEAANSTFSANTARSEKLGAHGGAIANGGSLMVRRGTFSGNRARAEKNHSFGGAMSIGDEDEIVDSVFVENTAQAGGAISAFGSDDGARSAIEGSRFLRNSADIIGGAISTNNPLLRIVDSTLSGNSAPSGGAINHFRNELVVRDSTISGNSAEKDGGGILNSESAAGGNAGTIRIIGSTLRENEADRHGGGVFNGRTGLVVAQNSTLSANTAAKDGGGAYVHKDAVLDLDSVTVTENHADRKGGGIFVKGDGLAEIKNTILAQNSVDKKHPDISGRLDSESHNLIGDTTGVHRTFRRSTADQTGVAPELGPLAINFDPEHTRSHRPKDGSPAVDAGESAFDEDQRDITRPQGRQDDVGAVELELQPPDDGSDGEDGEEAAFDYGDAPEDGVLSGYPTTNANEGARHLVPESPEIFLGELVDTEEDGQPSSSASGDDGDGTDDEDGVRPLSTFVFGKEAKIEVTANADGRLDAWVDLNRDGDWDDPEERVLSGRELSRGTQTVTFVLPQPDDAKEGESFVRYRFSSGGVAQPSGEAPDGEVEDYTVSLHHGCDPRTCE